MSRLVPLHMVEIHTIGRERLLAIGAGLVFGSVQELLVLG
jgi:hypothetical protein